MAQACARERRTFHPESGSEVDTSREQEEEGAKTIWIRKVCIRAEPSATFTRECLAPCVAWSEITILKFKLVKLAEVLSSDSSIPQVIPSGPSPVS